jgi:hypothetical protein
MLITTDELVIGLSVSTLPEDGAATDTPPPEAIVILLEPPDPSIKAPAVARLSRVVSRLLAPFWKIAKSSVPTVPLADSEKVANGVVAVEINDSKGVVAVAVKVDEILAAGTV